VNQSRDDKVRGGETHCRERETSAPPLANSSAFLCDGIGGMTIDIVSFGVFLARHRAGWSSQRGAVARVRGSTPSVAGVGVVDDRPPSSRRRQTAKIRKDRTKRPDWSRASSGVEVSERTQRSRYSQSAGQKCAFEIFPCCVTLECDELSYRTIGPTKIHSSLHQRMTRIVRSSFEASLRGAFSSS
jgi:hypothetical protein